MPSFSHFATHATSPSADKTLEAEDNHNEIQKQYDMAEEKHHHHLFHHKNKEEEGGPVDYEKEVKHHSHLEKIGELGAVAAGAFALHEKHKAKKDPENAHKHKIEEEIAAVAAVGAGGFAFHEHHQKKDSKKEKKEAEGGHHY